MAEPFGENSEHRDSRSEARRRIDAYLDSVEQALSAAGAPRERRRAIADDVEAQIADMLRPTDPSAATVAEVDAVLKRLDPPSAYTTPTASSVVSIESGSPPAPPAAPPMKLCLQALRAALECGLGLLIALGFSLAFFSVHVVVENPANPQANSACPPSVLWLLVATALTGVVFGTAEGWLALAKLHRSSGRLYGTTLAVFAACAMPIVATVILSCVLWHLAAVAYYDSAFISDRGVSIQVIGSVLTAVVFSGLLVRSALRYGRSAESVSPPGHYAPAAKLA